MQIRRLEGRFWREAAARQDAFPKISPGAKELSWIRANFLFGPVASWMFVADKPREAS